MFSEILKKLRKERGVSQASLAEYLQMSQQAIGSWETNRATPDLDTLMKLADYFNVSTDYLLGTSKDNAENTAIAAAIGSNNILKNLFQVANISSPGNIAAVTNLLLDLNKVNVESDKPALKKGFHHVKKEPEEQKYYIEDYF